MAQRSFRSLFDDVYVVEWISTSALNGSSEEFFIGFLEDSSKSSNSQLFSVLLGKKTSWVFSLHRYQFLLWRLRGSWSVQVICLTTSNIELKDSFLAFMCYLVFFGRKSMLGAENNFYSTRIVNFSFSFLFQFGVIVLVIEL